ncbi:MAG: hypothetical protein AB7G37_16945 [Solirubrobacteraceae bacterium]
MRLQAVPSSPGPGGPAPSPPGIPGTVGLSPAAGLAAVGATVLGVAMLAGLLWITEPWPAFAATIVVLVGAAVVVVGLSLWEPHPPGLGISTAPQDDPAPDPHATVRRVGIGASVAIAIIAAHLSGLVAVALLADHWERVVVAVRLLLAYVPPLLVAAGALALGSAVGAAGVGFVVPGLLMGVALGWDSDPAPVSLVLALLAVATTVLVVWRPWRGNAEIVLATAAGAFVLFAVQPYAAPAFSFAVGPLMAIPRSPVGNVMPGAGHAILLALVIAAAIALVVAAIRRRRPWDGLLPASVLVMHAGVVDNGPFGWPDGSQVVVTVVAFVALAVGLWLLLSNGTPGFLQRLPERARELVAPTADGPIAFFGVALVGVAVHAVPILIDPGRGRAAVVLVLLGLAVAIASALRGAGGTLVAGVALVGLALEDPIADLLIGPQQRFVLDLLPTLGTLVVTAAVVVGLVRACPHPAVVAAGAFALLGPAARVVAWCAREGDAGPTAETLLPLFLPIGVLLLAAGLAAWGPRRFVAHAQAAGGVVALVGAATAMVLVGGGPRAAPTILGFVEVAPTAFGGAFRQPSPGDTTALVLTLLLVGGLPLAASLARRPSLSAGAGIAYLATVVAVVASPAVEEHRAVVAIVLLLVGITLVVLASVAAVAEGGRAREHA